ncbi:MAG: DUF4476 domain-containing protein [Aureispira sp.]
MKSFIVLLILSPLLLACTINSSSNTSGSISGEASGKYENNSSSEYTETVNGKVVKSIKSSKTEDGGGEVEFNISLGERADEETIDPSSFNPKITCVQALDASAVERIKQQLLKETLDKTRVFVAKRAMNEHCLSSNQIRDILALFTMDKYKLEVAKFAYGHCTDRTNYGRIKDAFSLRGTKKLLDNYINTL